MIQNLRPRPVAPCAGDLHLFRTDVLRGLGQRAKRLPAKYFYDQRGSELFDTICELDEYYLTRSELAIMRQEAAAIAGCLPADGVLIEFGSGSSIKTRLLLDHLPELRAYVPIDISEKHLLTTAKCLQQRYERLDVLPVAADFTDRISLPPLPEAAPRTVYFPGSTIGNFQHDEASGLLGQIASLTGPRGLLLIGIDLQKPPAVIEAAYNDRCGVTAEFNLNLLRRINRELEGDFQLPHFAHEASYDIDAGRIEMRLRCTAAQTVRVADRSFRINQGETIHTEYSHKYTVQGFAELASDAGFVLQKQWLDERQYFAVLLFEYQAVPQ